MSDLALKRDTSLKAFNTLQLESKAKVFVEITKEQDALKLPDILKKSGDSFFVLGGGSNVILPPRLDGLIILMNTKGITTKDAGEFVFVTAQAGENWSDFVDFTASKDLFGIETLALIPGTVGAAPIQNIGAYGTELKDTFDHLRALNLKTGEVKNFSLTDCQFSYRQSNFKTDLGRGYLILDVTLKLTKKRASTDLNREVAAALSSNAQTAPLIAEAVKSVRRRKLPDPAVHPNVGSFFLNPVFDEVTFNSLKAKLPDVPFFDTPTGKKVPAAWIIERAGWKGKQVGQVGMSPSHALVLVNHGAPSSEDILNFARELQKDVEQKFGVRLEMEPPTAATHKI